MMVQNPASDDVKWHSQYNGRISDFVLFDNKILGGKCMTNMTNPHYDDGICNNQSLLQQSKEMQQSQGH